MIRKIALTNFLSYRSAAVEFRGSTVAVAGENGSGKSSLLEAIPYALYGVGRDTLANMSRINGDGSHEVSVHLDGGIEVTRGVKAGKGYCTVRSDGDLLASGREATDWVRQYLRMDVDLFLLTSFFGLHDVRHDSLIRVAPSVRLEALQRLSNVGPYRQFHAAAKDRSARSKSALERATARRDGAQVALSSSRQVKADIAAERAALRKAQSKYRALVSRRSDLQVDENKYRSAIAERNEIGVACTYLDREIEKLTQERDDEACTLRMAKDASDAALRGKRETKLPSIDPDAYRARIETAQKALDSASYRLALLRQVGEVTGNACPLCAAPVSAAQLADWDQERSALVGVMERQRNAIRGDQNSVEHFRSTEKRIARFSDELARAAKQGQESSDELARIDREMVKLEGERAAKKSRHFDLCARLDNDHATIKADLEEVNAGIDVQQSAIAAAKKGIKVLEGQLGTITVTKRLIAECDGEIARHSADVVACELLVRAWSRYGIPMELMRNTMRTIAEVSTDVYREFDDGRITVEEVEDRGKPGVEFYLSDRRGRRTFSQLSAGEKVMFFVSVRVAVSEIAARNGARKADFLVLDEAMGNLSPRRRDDLVRLINKVLRKRYPQVIMVSHTVMRDIFTETVQVTADGGVSTLEVA